MPRPELSVIVPAHNEAALIESTLGAITEQLLASADIARPELIVVASACQDSTGELATELLTEHNEVRHRILAVSKAGKKRALNAGLEVAKGDMVLCIDGDVIATPGAIERAYTDMHEPGARLIGGQYAPRVAEHWVNNRPAPSIELLKYARRQVTQPHRDVPGCFVGFFRKDLRAGYSEGAAPDDRWLSAYMGTRFGLSAIRLNQDVAVTYAPPMTLTDLQEQVSRYRRTQAVMDREHPELMGYFRDLQSHWAAVDGDDMQQRWRAQATEYGLDFDRWHMRYQQMIRHADKRLHDKRRLPRRDFWVPARSTKVPVLAPRDAVVAGV